MDFKEAGAAQQLLTPGRGAGRPLGVSTVPSQAARSHGLAGERVPPPGCLPLKWGHTRQFVFRLPGGSTLGPQPSPSVPARGSDVLDCPARGRTFSWVWAERAPPCESVCGPQAGLLRARSLESPQQLVASDTTGRTLTRPPAAPRSFPAVGHLGMPPVSARPGLPPAPLDHLQPLPGETGLLQPGPVLRDPLVSTPLPGGPSCL